MSWAPPELVQPHLKQKFWHHWTRRLKALRHPRPLKTVTTLCVCTGTDLTSSTGKGVQISSCYIAITGILLDPWKTISIRVLDTLPVLDYKVVSNQFFQPPWELASSLQIFNPTGSGHNDVWKPLLLTAPCGSCSTSAVCHWARGWHTPYHFGVDSIPLLLLGLGHRCPVWIGQINWEILEQVGLWGQFSDPQRLDDALLIRSTWLWCWSVHTDMLCNQPSRSGTLDDNSRSLKICLSPCNSWALTRTSLHWCAHRWSPPLFHWLYIPEMWPFSIDSIS